LPATPSCVGKGEVTPAQTAGPFFKPRSPRRTSLIEPGMAGTRIIVTGSVLSTDCRPIAGALIDVWQADDRGEYDNAGFRLRGHQFADEQGRYRLETIVPGAYSGRTRHIHVRVQAPNQAVLTTQLYFPGEPGNARDFIFRPELVMAVRDAENPKTATFDFVLPVAGSKASG
jgi:protocatechuate 3,4-dioxygenase beta subunit